MSDADRPQDNPLLPEPPEDEEAAERLDPDAPGRSLFTGEEEAVEPEEPG